MRLSQEERAELLALSKSESLRNDCAWVAEHRQNPFMVNGEVDCDRVVDFLNDYNDFVGHAKKSRTPFIETNMKL